MDQLFKLILIIFLYSFWHSQYYIMKSTFKILNEVDKTIILHPQKPLFSLIWLHGLGDSSAGFFEFFQLPQSPLHRGCRVKLLHAPIQPVTINGGIKMPSWYDLKVMSFEGAEADEDKRCSLSEVKESLNILNKKVEEEVQFWKQQKVEGDIYKRIFVGGFSQGCAVSLLYGLTNKNIIGGVIGLSGYLFSSFELPNLGKLPIFLCHGLYDNMIPVQVSKRSYQRILKNPSVVYRQKDLDHEVSIQQLEEITKWMMTKLTILPKL